MPMMRVLCRSVIVVAAMAVGVRIVHVVDMTGHRHRAGSVFDLTSLKACRKPRPFIQRSRTPTSTMSA